MAEPMKIERKSFDPRTMDQNWDRSNDKYVAMLAQQQEIEAAASGQAAEGGFFWSLFRGASKKAER